MAHKSNTTHIPLARNSYVKGEQPGQPCLATLFDLLNHISQPSGLFNPQKYFSNAQQNSSLMTLKQHTLDWLRKGINELLVNSLIV